MSDEVLTRLHQFENLGDCPEADLVELAEHAEAVDVPANWAFILEGMPADSCYLVLEGTVSLRKAGEEFARVGAGSLVGEIAIIEERSRTATCVALTPLRLLEIQASEFNGWLHDRPELRARLLASAREVTH